MVFIVLEVPDCSGTTKQTGILAQKLESEGIDFVQALEPADNKIGKHIRQILFEKPLPSPDALQLLFTAARAEHNAEVLRPALEENKHIICERYSLSTLIYGEAAGVDRSWLEAANSTFIQPDLTIITLPPFEVCKERLLNRENRDELEKVDFQAKIHALYAKEVGPNTVFVDTSGTIDESAEQIWSLVKPLVF